jgi:hypothetical protein
MKRDIAFRKIHTLCQRFDDAISVSSEDDRRRVDQHEITIGQAWELERPCLLPLPSKDFDCCTIKPVKLMPYSQVEFDTNRYSIAADKVVKNLVIKAYPFQVKIGHGNETIAELPRCYGPNQDVFDPLHYLPLLEQRPGAFENAKPLRRWRSTWPPVYEQLLERLKAEGDERRGIREFVSILKLHRDFPPDCIEQAVTQALRLGCIHADGVRLCLHQLMNPVAM